MFKLSELQIKECKLIEMIILISLIIYNDNNMDKDIILYGEV